MLCDFASKKYFFNKLGEFIGEICIFAAPIKVGFIY